MSKHLRLVPLALGLALALPACGSGTSRFLGLTRDAPDEFVVVTRAPLSMPPDMTGSLPTPRPGAGRPMERSSREAAEATLAPGTALAPAGPTRGGSGEAALLSQVQRGNAPPDIRRRVDEESSRLDAPERSVTDRLMFWRDTPPPGTAVDATRENARLRENAALGREVTNGDTPIIQRPRRSFLGIF
ncbi:MAG: hypothetical protein JWO26_3668 [Rhodospirillales bacterium]|nr:hypothetical protein [Rhodospirillales bacterium]